MRILLPFIALVTINASAASKACESVFLPGNVLLYKDAYGKVYGSKTVFGRDGTYLGHTAPMIETSGGKFFDLRVSARVPETEWYFQFNPDQDVGYFKPEPFDEIKIHGRSSTITALLGASDSNAYIYKPDVTYEVYRFEMRANRATRLHRETLRNGLTMKLIMADSSRDFFLLHRGYHHSLHQADRENLKGTFVPNSLYTVRWGKTIKLADFDETFEARDLLVTKDYEYVGIVLKQGGLRLYSVNVDTGSTTFERFLTPLQVREIREGNRLTGFFGSPEAKALREMLVR